MGQFVKVFAGLIVALLALASPLAAQTSDAELAVLADRLEQIERDMTDLQREIYQGRSGGASSSWAEPKAVADPVAQRLSERVDELEQEIRRLTGQIEELGFKINQLTTQLEQSQAATNARLDKLDGGAGAQASTNGAPQPGTPVSGNSAEQPGLAPGPTVLGQVPSDSVPEADKGTYQEQYERALGYLRQQDYPRAEAAFRLFIAENGETDLVGPAMFWLGETYFIQDKRLEAAQTFLEALRKHPNNPKAPDSMLKLGMSLAKLGDTQQSCAAFRDLPKKYPNASQTILQRAKVEAERAGCK